MAFVLKPRQPVFLFVPENALVHVLRFRTAKDLYDHMLCVANSDLDLRRCKIQSDEHIKTQRVPVKILIRVMNRTIDRCAIRSERLFVPHVMEISRHFVPLHTVKKYIKTNTHPAAVPKSMMKQVIHE